MGIQFEQRSRNSELVGGGNGIIARVKNVSRPILREELLPNLGDGRDQAAAG